MKWVWLLDGPVEAMQNLCSIVSFPSAVGQPLEMFVYNHYSFALSLHKHTGTFFPPFLDTRHFYKCNTDSLQLQSMQSLQKLINPQRMHTWGLLCSYVCATCELERCRFTTQKQASVIISLLVLTKRGCKCCTMLVTHPQGSHANEVEHMFHIDGRASNKICLLCWMNALSCACEKYPVFS